MAMDKTTMFSAPFKLLNHGTSGAINFSTGGTNVGEVLHHAAKGLQRLTTQVGYQARPGADDGRWFADVAMLEVIIGQRTDEFMKLAYKPQYQTGQPTLVGAAQIKPGHLLRRGGHTLRLQIRAVNADGTVDTTKPCIYIPHGFVAAVGPTVWDVGELHLQATVLTIQCYNDSTGTPYYEDIATSLPAVSS